MAPFDAGDDEDVMRSIVKREPNYSSSVSYNLGEAAKDLLRSLLYKSVGERPTADVALEHEWFEDQPPDGTPAELPQTYGDQARRNSVQVELREGLTEYRD